MTNKERLAAAKKRIQAAKSTCEQIIRSVFDESAAELFEKHERLKSFSWRQYTPYFNDGETCVFGSNSDYPDIVLYGNDMEGDVDLEEGWADESSLTYEDDKKISDDVKEFLGQFDDDDYMDLFGDHARVTVDRTGSEVDECDHD